MQFSTKAAALQPHQEGALLYICRNRENAPDNETARLLLESLAEGERFAAAQTAESGKLKAVAVALPENDGRDALEKAAVEAAAWAQKQENPHIGLNGFDPNQAAEAAEIFALAFGQAAYRFNRFKKDAKAAKLNSATFHTEHADAVQTALNWAEAQLYGINLCKDLGNTAPNVCTPKYLADTARAEAEKFGAAAKIHDKDHIREHMGSFWSVAKGSAQDPYLIELHWRGAADKNAAPVVLVGKGITFDSGGISLKPGEAMDEMKYDMCGAASVIGAST